MRGDLEAALRSALAGEVGFDRYTRHLYATDASMYAIEPIGVVSPRHADDVCAAIEIAARFGVPVLPRGAGTSLAGQTVGHAVVLDFSRHMHNIVRVDEAAKTANVQPGVVQDDLNRTAGRYGLMFAADTSTANRATLGGMIGNNSCGARSARYGMTIDHVDALDVILSDGSRATLSAVAAEAVATRARADTLQGRLYRELPALVAAHADAIRSGFPPHWRRTGGYRLERLLPERGPLDLSKLVVGSEGTLAIVVEASVRLVPVPSATAALAGHFHDVQSALAALDDALDCEAAAIELVDRFILDLARRSSQHGHSAAALVGQPGALLWVEFHGDSPADAAAQAERLEQRWRNGGHGYAVVRATTTRDLARFRELRKAGLGLLSAAGLGRERSLAFVEDTAVDPRRLAEYTREFTRILDAHGLRAGFYGHASAGCLHIRPFIDLLRPGEIERMRSVAEEVSQLVSEFGGMNSSEHGDGLARAEFSRRLLGSELYDAMREVKRIFDPEGRLNPGKKVDAPRMTEHLREPALPQGGHLVTYFDFAAEGGMRGVANRCVRIGACRTSADAGGTMCPSFMATREEEHSTRGRANALVLALSSADPRAALGDQRLHEVLDLCLECKACRAECPMSVDMAALKAEALAQRYAQHGTPTAARFFGHARALNSIGSAFAPLSNGLLAARPARWILERVVGLDRRRPLPPFRRQSLARWFAQRQRAAAARGPGPESRRAVRRTVIFLADSFTSFTEPEIGRASIELLERAGWSVRLAASLCCGRALISKGLLDEARREHAMLLDQLGPSARAGIPIVGCEPSCIFTLKHELPALAPAGDERAAAIASQAHLVDELLLEALEAGRLSFDTETPAPDRNIIFHAHCHQKAAGAVAPTAELLRKIPNARVTVLDAGCCGMAGSFGHERRHYELSQRIGALRLFPAVNAAPDNAIIAATGVSCRQQIAHGTNRTARHPVSIVHAALESTPFPSQADEPAQRSTLNPEL